LTEASALSWVQSVAAACRQPGISQSARVPQDHSGNQRSGV